MGSDPTPGDPQRVEQLADDVAEFAESASEAYSTVRDLLNDEAVASFVGETATAFKDRFDDVPGNLKKLWQSYELAADALAAYWPKLADAQADADRALADAETARADLTSAESWLERATTAFDSAEEEVEDPDPEEVSAEARRALTEARGDRDDAQEAVASAQGALAAAKALAEQAKEAREEAARACADDLSAASDAGMRNKSWWQKAIDWVVDNWDTIVDIAKIVVAVLGVVVMIIGGPLAWVVLAAALVVLADSIIKYANGEGSLWDVAFAALDCIPGFKGITTLAGLAGGIKSYVKNFSNMKAMFDAEGIRGVGKVLIGDPIDIATGEMTLRNTDLQLPGVLPLVLEREHLSNYRHGRWFGPSWASTLDQRLHLDQFGVHYFADDGMILHYPIPNPAFGEPVLPIEGPRWPLAWDGTPGSPMHLTQTDTGRTLHFHHTPGHPGAALPLTAITDRNTNRITIHYNDAGEPVEITHTGGYRIGIAVYDHRITSLTLLSDPDQPVLRAFDYDERGNLTGVYNSSGLPLRFAYDKQRRMTRWEDRNNTWYRYEYDEAGRCVFTTGTDRALEYRYAYDTENRTTTATNSLGHTTTYRMNDRYQVVAETNPHGHTTHKEWSPRHELLTETDPLGRTTHYTYNPDGQLTELQRPDGSTIHAEYNDLGQVTELTRPDGSTLAFAYDGAGNRAAVLEPDGRRTRYAFHPTGGPAAITDSLGQTIRIDCDAAGLPVGMYEPGGESTAVTRDSFGRPVAITDPTGSRTELVWSVEGRLIRRKDPLGEIEAFVWDPEGNLLSATDPNGGVTTHTYGPFDLPTSTTAPDGTTHTFTRDTELRLLSVTDPAGRVWSYTYDPLGMVVAEDDYDGRVTAYSHDAAGQTRKVTNPAGQTLTLSYDLLGQLTEKRSAGNERWAYTYDPLGRMVAASSPGAELTRKYDSSGNLLVETVNGRRLQLAYGPDGQLAERTTPSGHQSTWTYTSSGLPRTLTTDGQILTFTHDPAGRETARTIGDNLRLTHTWDAAGRLTHQDLTNAQQQSPIVDRIYRYRPDHALTEVIDAREGVRLFDLDPLGQITRAVTPTGTETYTYDPCGNQTLATWPVTAQNAQGAREYDGTLLVGAGRTRYEQDAAGRTVRRRKSRLSKKPDTWRYTWNAHNELIETITPDGKRWTYTYDPLGRRISKQLHSDDGTVIQRICFTWHDTTLIEEADTRSGHIRTWNYGGLAPLTQTDHTVGQNENDRRFHAVVTDLVGTPNLLVDTTGNHTWRQQTTTWGVPTHTAADGTTTPLRFPGQYYDAETGWHYNYHRHYDPELARYTTPDPLGLGPSPNPHTYVLNPFTWTDPLGLAGHSPYKPLDSLGRATGIHTTLTKNNIGGKTNPRVDPAGWVSGQGYNRAHLLGAQLGGSNSDPRNFVTMHGYANTPVMRRIENQVRRAVEQGGQTVDYTVTPVYSGSDPVPLGVTIEAIGSGGLNINQTILNRPKP